MKRSVIPYLLASSVLVLSGCGPSAPAGSLPPSATAPGVSASPEVSPEPQTEAQRQIAAFAADPDAWQLPDDRGWRGYAVTDLDQDGNWELITALDEGTGHFTTTAIFEADPLHPPFTRVGLGRSLTAEDALEALSHGGPIAAGPLLLPHWELDDGPQQYPVYRDRDNGAYYYIYEDTISNVGSRYGTFSTLLAFSLNQDGAEGILLGCEKATYGDAVTRDRWDLYGNYIDQTTYEELARTHFEGLEELEAGILWVSPAHGEVLDEAAWYQLLTTSMEGFSLTEA